MLNRMINMINGLKERDLNEGINVNDINEFGFILIRNSFILNYYGMAIAGAFIADKETIGKDNVPMIIVDDNFYEMSDNGKAFVIAHELGHFQSNHQQQVGGYERKINDEFEADECGAKLVGYQSAVFALEELEEKILEVYEFCDKELVQQSVDEIELRIENLLNKSNIVTC